LHTILSTKYFSSNFLCKLAFLAFCLGIGRTGISQDSQDSTPAEQNAPAEQQPPPADFWLPPLQDSEDQTGGTKLKDQVLPTEPVNESAPTSDEVAPENAEPGHVFNKWKFIPYASLQSTFDDNIFISKKDKQSDLYFTFSPGIAVGWGAVRKDSTQSVGYFRQVDTPKVEINPPEQGNYVVANYSMSQSLFTDHTSQNSLDHDASLAGEWRFEKILLGARARFQTLSDADINVGGRAKRNVLSLALTSNYSLSEKTSLEVDLARTTNDYDSGVKSTDTSAQNWLNYQVTGKISAGVGLTLGNVEVENSPNQTYEQILMRGAYNTPGKLSFSANGGLEARQIDGNDKYNPVFTVGATYSPVDQTTIYLEAFRHTFDSVTTAGENIVTDGVTLRVRQRCFEKVYLTLSGGYESGKYEENLTSITTNRTDDIFYFKSSISFAYTKWANMELAYEYRNNQSTLSDSSFKQNLITLQLNVFF
jgi:hypothetical protein